MLAPRGRSVIIGSRGDATITPRDLMSRDVSIHGMMLWNLSERDAADAGAAIAAGLESGTLRPVVGKELPLADAPAAHEAVMKPGAFGKIVLLP